MINYNKFRYLMNSCEHRRTLLGRTSSPPFPQKVHTGHMAYAFSGMNGFSASSTRRSSASKNPRSCFMRLMSHIPSSTSLHPTIWLAKTSLKSINFWCLFQHCSSTKSTSDKWASIPTTDLTRLSRSEQSLEGDTGANAPWRKQANRATDMISIDLRDTLLALVSHCPSNLHGAFH